MITNVLWAVSGITFERKLDPSQPADERAPATEKSRRRAGAKLAVTVDSSFEGVLIPENSDLFKGWLNGHPAGWYRCQPYKTSARMYTAEVGFLCEWLVQVHRVLGVSTEELTSDPVRWHGFPFYELVDIFLLGGVLGSSTCTKLRKDFAVYHSRMVASLAGDAMMTYANLDDLIELASGGFLVIDV